MNQIISSVRVFEHNGNYVTTSHDISRLTGIPHSDVLKSIYVQKQYYEQLNRAHVFERDFIRTTEAGIKGTSSLNSNPRKRGRPSIVYLLTKEGAFSFIGGLRGVKACEFRLVIAEAFVVLEQALKQSIEEIAALRIENAQLREKPKALLGTRKGQVISPVMHENLFGQIEAIRWERRLRDSLDQETQAKAHARHMRKMLKGLAEKYDALVERIDLMEGNKTAKVIRLLSNKKDPE